jgi:type II secretory pathway component GspD/PulD (secretin)
MRRTLTSLLLIAALVTALAATAALGQGGPADDQQPLINIDVKEAPIDQVLRMLAKAAQVNILIGQDVSGTIPAVSLRDVTVETALRMIARSQGFFWYKEDNVYVISKQPPTGAVVGSGGEVTSRATGPVETAVAAPATGGAPLPGAVAPGSGTPTGPSASRPSVSTIPAPPQPAEAARGLEPRVVPAMLALSFADAGQIAVMFGGSVCSGGTANDVFSNMRAPSERRKGLSRGGSRGLGAAEVFAGGFSAPSRGAGGWGQEGLPGGGGRGGTTGGTAGVGGQQQGGRGGGLGGGGGGGGALGGMLPGEMDPPIAFMPQNSLLVRGTQEEIDTFREILELLDKPTKQVEISTKFIEVQTTADKALGIDWSLSNGSLEFFNQGFAPGEAVNNVVRFARGRFEAQLNALLSSGRATVINEPHVVTMNNQFAEVNFFTTIPYFSAQISYNQFGNREVEFTSEFIDVENSLWVVPRINSDDTITVYLEPTLEDTVGEVEGPNGERIPIVTSQYVSTQVRVADGETVVLGGLIRRDESSTLRETPLLSRIPIIGKLFQGRRLNKRNSELLIFVTPRIVREVPAQ